MYKPHAVPQAFADLGLEVPFLNALAKMGWTQPSDIQTQMIPLVLQGRDIIGQARTGTGKTGAFGLPILQMVRKDEGLQFLVLTPTRELAVQVAAELRRLVEHAGLRIVPVYGGQKIKQQLHLLGRKPCVVVGTPGRVIDLLQRRVLSFGHVRFVVLDEVDRMLDIGFRDDIRHILSQVTGPHQTVLVSATISDEIKRLAGRYMNDPVEVNVSRDELTVEEVEQVYMTVDPWDKYRLLRAILEHEKPKVAIVFCNTKRAVSKLTMRLHADRIDAKEIHGDLVQSKRERVMEHFRKHNLHVLVATDLAARGIDVQGITHIINYDVPDDSEVYVHRIGRTARMGSFGRAITLATREQGKQLTEIEKLINKQIPLATIEGFTSRPPPRDDLWIPRSPAPAAMASATEQKPERRPAEPVREDAFGTGLIGESPATHVTAQPTGVGSRARIKRKRRR